MREPPAIAQDRLAACLVRSFDIQPVSIEYLALGHDYFAGVYRVLDGEGSAYLVKVKSRVLYEPSCRVPYHLYHQGISSVVAPIPTLQNELWTRLDDWIVIVYPFIQGDTSLIGMTDAQWEKVGAAFKQIHTIALPPDIYRSLKTETFDPTAYIRWVNDFETHHLGSSRVEGSAERALYAAWDTHASKIHTGLTMLQELGAQLKSRSLPYVLCHADLHAANVLRDSLGNVFIIDWDEVMSAPKERDFIFLNHQADAFWQGYGSRDPDSTALTYYLWERVIQDVIEYAAHICSSNDLSQETKMNLVRRFESAFRADGLLARIPSGLQEQK